MKLYISFGQSHAHSVNGKTFDKDSICEIECEDWMDGRKQAHDAFGEKFAFDYTKEQITETTMIRHFPRGIIKLNN